MFQDDKGLEDTLDPIRLKRKVADLIHREAGRLSFTTDSQGVVTSYQEDTLEELGMTPDSILGQNIENIIEKVTPDENELTFIEDGFFFAMIGARKFKLKTTSIITEDGEGVAYFVILSKVEDMAQDYIEKAEESKMLFENSPLAMALVDHKMRAKTVNDAARDLLSIKHETDLGSGKCGELIGCYNSTYGKGCGTNRPCKDCVIRNTVNATFKDFLPRDKVEGDFLVSRNGCLEIRRIQVWTRMVADRSKVLLALNDITDVRNVERSLREANQKLNLLSSITRHDTLNSLTTMSLLVEMGLEIESLDEGAQSYLKRMRGVVREIEQQINFTKLYQDLGTQNPQWHLMTKVIGESIPDDMPLELVIDGSLDGLEVLADPMLSRVFHNLFENAVRHGEHCTMIEVSAVTKNDRVEILLHDNGVGVEECDKEAIFSRGFGKNSGLGLFLSKEILSITDLEISEVGEFGKGACFLIDVPFTGHRKKG